MTDKKHLRAQWQDAATQYKAPPPPRLPTKKQPRTDFVEHAQRLNIQLEGAWTSAMAKRKNTATHIERRPRGIVLHIISAPNTRLNLEKLQLPSKGIELLNARVADGRQEASIFVPDKRVSVFQQRLKEYEVERTAAGEPKHWEIFETIAQIRAATLLAMWTDAEDRFPTNRQVRVSWEIWLRHDEKARKNTALEQLRELSALFHIDVDDDFLRFPDRTVVLVMASTEALENLLSECDEIAEIREGKVTTSFFVQDSARDQRAWIQDLLGRTTLAPDDAPAVCLFDTGLAAGHPLLEDSVCADGVLAYHPSWDAADHHSHGTLMAGLALYGDLGPLLAARKTPVVLENRLESVKILPAGDAINDPRNHGVITRDSVSRIELARPDGKRVFCSAVTALLPERGRASSWSAEIDNLCAGADTGVQSSSRLFLICAGNNKQFDGSDYFSRAVGQGILDPGQAWNALTVGAITHRVHIEEEMVSEGWRPLATTPGDLSPISPSSLSWESDWPNKPDLVLEGGNVAVDSLEENFGYPHELSLLSTRMKSTGALLGAMNATSAATALAARMAASIWATYPDFWAETVRALLVSSARWTPVMKRRVSGLSAREQARRLVRIFGFGTPDVYRAKYCVNNRVSVVFQDELIPYSKDKMNQMRFHRLPWPKEYLESLGATPITMRVVLSYFVEANPGERGWKYRHRYASHGFRFEAKLATETQREFQARINKAITQIEAADSAGLPDSDSESNKRKSKHAQWFVGGKNRSAGSLHVDEWSGTAAELASCDSIAVYPVIGWWKERHALRRTRSARYAMVLTLETSDTLVDLYTTIENQINVLVGLPVEIS